MNNYLKFYIISIFLCPCFYGFLSLSVGQLLYLFFVTAISIVYLLCINKLVNTKLNKRIIIFILLYGLLLIIYSLSTLKNLRSSFSSGDFIEFLRPLIYIMTLIISYVIINSPIWQTEKTEILSFIDKIVFIFSLFEWLKFIQPLCIIFKFWNPWPYGSINYIRMSGMTGFAYSYAWVILILLYFNISLVRKINFKFFYYSVLVLLTGSRTSFLALMLLYVVIYIRYKNLRHIFILGVGLITISVAVMYFANVTIVRTSIDYILNLIMTILGKGQDGSLTTRNVQKEKAMEMFYSSPWLGVGSDKANQVTIENFFYHHLRNWGILGLGVYLICVFNMWLLVPKARQHYIFAIILVSTVLCFSTPIFDLVRIFNILYLFIAFFMDKQKNIKPIYYQKRNVKWIKYFLKISN